MKLLTDLLHLIYPSEVKCPFCGGELISSGMEVGFCNNCLNQLHLFKGQAVSDDELDLVGSAVHYRGFIKDIIYRFKYFGERTLAYPLVDLMLEQYPYIFKGEKWTGLIPVPMHEKRLSKRGYNQAYLLARGLSFSSGIPCYDWVIRAKNTRPQNKLKLEARKRNMEGAFQLRNTASLQNGSWLVIDDIFTTGTTARGMARTLKSGGAKRVGLYTVASGRLISDV